MSEKATIKDVATVSGTSVGTVSRFLNGTLCRGERRRRVEEAIRSLNYIPNLYARAVRAVNSKCIGILIEQRSMKSHFWIQSFLFSLMPRISHSNYTCFVQVVDGLDSNHGSLLFSANMDGLILIGSFDDGYIQSLTRTRPVPMVSFWEPISQTGGSSLSVDLSSGMTQLVEHLIALGHSKIGVVNVSLKINQEKVDSFLRTIRRYLPDYDSTFITTASSGEEIHVHSAAATARLLEAHPETTALFYLSDAMVLGGLGELSRRRLRVPDDISVASFDNSLLAVNTVPELTSLGVDYDQLADLMLNELIFKIEKGEEAALRVPPVVSFAFFRRGSTAPIKNKK